MQLTEQQSNQLYPKKSDKIWFLMHAYNEEDCIARCLNSVKDIAYKMVVLIDDRTTDRTKDIAESLGAVTFSFKWIHSFAYAKNLCLQKAMSIGLEYGDWVLFMGADFELHTFDLDFVKNPYNFFGQFEVPEAHKEGEQFVSRKRKLLWRHHPYIYWEKLVHEEAVYSSYRMTGLGVVFGTAKYKEYPVVGEMLHYGFMEDGGEQGKIFWRKKCYYKILVQIQKIMLKNNSSEPDKELLLDLYSLKLSDKPREELLGELDSIVERYKWKMLTDNSDREIMAALRIIYNNPDLKMTIDEAINSLLERYLAGDIPQGLAEVWRDQQFELGIGEYV